MVGGSNIISADWVCRYKMDKTVTPVKTFTRIHLTPLTKEFLRIACGEKIENAQYRLKE